jgi:fatty-acyl-CoA synthase
MSIKAYDWIANHAYRTPDKVASVDLFSERSLTYAEMDRRVGRLAQFLSRSLGIERGDRVAILARNSTDIFDLQFACQRLGAIMLPLNWRLAVPELEFIISDASPKVLIFDDFFADSVSALNEAGVAPLTVEMHPDGSASEFEYGIGHAKGEVAPVELSHDDIVTILYTSGTTGLPKGAMITYGMNFWNAVNLGLPALVTPKTVHLSILPLFTPAASTLTRTSPTMPAARSWYCASSIPAAPSATWPTPVSGSLTRWACRPTSSS